MNIVPWDSLPMTLSWKEKVAFLAATMMDLPHSDKRPIEHSFGHGLYIRKMTIPQGTIFIGREHIQGHEITLLEGTAILIRPEAKIEYNAVKTLHTVPGFQVIAYMVTDVTVQTVHANPEDLEDVDELENRIFRPAEDTLRLGREIRDTLRLCHVG
jgi:hypothetical protein